MCTNSAAVGYRPVATKAGGKRVGIRAKGAANRAKRAVAAKPAIEGAEIRARIAANRAKRLAIADAMKREAGVTEHTVHKEDLSGLAYIGTGKILSPQGRKIVQLCTLAHECGHIFLHNAGSGYWLASHVKELEAESYMHQAFREHGMSVPRWRTRSGREYIAWWIARDRAAGIPIDPRAEAYAWGRRSPFEALRMVPSTWRMFCAEGAPASPIGRLLARLRAGPLASEARAVIGLAGHCALYGYFAGLFVAYQFSDLYPDSFPRHPYNRHFTAPFHLAALTGALLLANVAVLWRTVRR